MFFDKPKVERAIDKATRKNMSRLGAFIQRRARSSIKRRKKYTTNSKPGKPPFNHSNSKFASLKNIWFFYDKWTETGVVGPVQFGKQRSMTVPQLMEFGGSTHGKPQLVRVTPKAARTGLSANGKALTLTHPYKSEKRMAKQEGRKEKHLAIIKGPRVYAPRPFMGPAFEQEFLSGKHDQIWLDSIEGSV